MLARCAAVDTKGDSTSNSTKEALVAAQSEKALLTTMEVESELVSKKAELSAEVAKIEAAWEGKPKDFDTLNKLMQLGLQISEIDEKLATVGTKLHAEK